MAAFKTEINTENYIGDGKLLTDLELSVSSQQRLTCGVLRHLYGLNSSVHFGSPTRFTLTVEFVSTDADGSGSTKVSGCALPNCLHFTGLV